MGVNLEHIRSQTQKAICHCIDSMYTQYPEKVSQSPQLLPRPSIKVVIKKHPKVEAQDSATLVIAR